jgi:hypothetical protein
VNYDFSFGEDAKRGVFKLFLAMFGKLTKHLSTKMFQEKPKNI